MQSLGLGAHVDKTLAKHQETHTQKVDEEQHKRQAGREERRERAETLGGKFAESLQRVGLWDKSDQFTNSVPKELDNGTVLVTHLKPTGGTYEETIKQVCSLKYVNEGSFVSRFSGRELSEQEVNEQGLTIAVSLRISVHSRDEELDIETEHQAHVGDLLDPESILVPEHDENSEPRYSVIGEDDTRFAAIMQQFEGFFNPDTGKIIDDIENVE